MKPDPRLSKNLACRLGLILACAASPVLANTYVVDTTSDSASLTACTRAAGDCSLRGAMLEANDAGGSNQITFDAAVFALPQTINLGASLPKITNRLSITGPGAALLSVDGQDMYRPFFVNGADTGIDGLTVTRGSAVQGGGMYVLNASATLSHMAFVANTASAGSGAIYLGNNADLRVSSSEFVDNQAIAGSGGAMGGRNGTTARVEDCTFTGNTAGAYGGAIMASGGLTLIGSTLAGNSAGDDGGGIRFQGNGALQVVNTTLTGNTAGASGGGISTTGSGDIINTTIAANSAVDSGAQISNSSTLDLENSIVAGGSASGDCSNSGTLNAHHSLIEEGLACVNGASASNLTGAVMLSVLADNGGPTETIALDATSPAIDAGDIDACPATDQRGIARPQDGDGNGISSCDIGAYEHVGSTGASLLVNTDSDASVAGDGLCSLREAIINANNDADGTAGDCAAGSGADTIKFAHYYTVTLGSSQLPSITSDITITGFGPANTIVQASTCDPVMLPGGCTAAGWRVLQVKSAGALSMNGVAVRYGNPGTGRGGAGIFNQGSLYLRDVQISANATDNVGGAGLLNQGDATLNRVTFDGNFCPSCGGGGLFSNGSAQLTDVEFDHNTSQRGGGLLHSNGTLGLNRVTFSANQATGVALGDNGGGMLNNAAATLTNVTFNGNLAAAAGGGLANTADGTLLTNVTFGGNAAATGQGGGLFNTASNLKLVNVILAGSSGGDCVNGAGAGLDATSSNNLIQDPVDSTCGLADGDANASIVWHDPLLGPLADNGGLTRTMALQWGSPAINAGSNGDCPSIDQRRVARPQGASCDIGAYEFVDTTPPALLSFTRHHPAAAVTNADTLTFRASFSEAVQNVDVGDFAVDGATTAAVTGVSAVDASHYDITVSGGDLAGFDGTVGLDLAAAQDITDAHGNALAESEPAADETYTVDNTPPAKPSLPDLDAGSDSGVSSTDNVTADSMPTFSGNAEADATVVLSSDVDGAIRSAVASGGAWSITPTSAMSEGMHEITATATDAAGNASPASAVLAVSIDTTPPVASISSAYSGSVNGPFDVTFDFGEPVYGFSSSDISLSNASVETFSSAPAGSTWPVTPTGADPSGIMISIAAGVVTDGAGNANIASPDFSLTYDTSIAGPLCYVNAVASGSNSGSPWSNAYTDLQPALGNPNCTEIWVAMGIYRPTPGGDRSVSFALTADQAVYGGFAGNETQRNQRDPGNNPTILSGDIGTPAEPGDNSYHVVVASGTSDSAVLDGFTITAGNANGTVPPTCYGGGLYVEAGHALLSNLLIEANNASNAGGGLAWINADNATATGVTFRANTSTAGGGAYIVDSAPLLVNVTFNGNTASTFGGGMLATNHAYPTLRHVTLSANHAGAKGGGIWNGLASQPALINTIASGNTATAGDNEIGNQSQPAMIRYSLVQGSGGSGGNWNAEVGLDQDGNIDADPLLGPLADNGGATPTMAIAPGSPAVDTAEDGSCAETDQRGVSRPQGAKCDIGAYEWVDVIFADGFEAVP